MIIHWLSLSTLWVATFLAAALITNLLRRYAIERRLLDLPNERSAHEVPTPRGGGLAIVISFLAALTLLAAAGAVPARVGIAIGGSGLIVAAIGFWDDHGHIPAAWRLLAHFTSAAWLLGWLGDIVPIAAVPAWVPTAVVHAAAALFVVWLLNLYNFMDGIDGIASVEAATTAFGGVLIYVLADEPGLAAVPALLSAAVLGFLVWNWPPARIFMGDVGSGFLGIVLSGLALQAGLAKPALFFSWLILLGVFVVDASLTLLRRALRGERVYEAHRSHAYQRCARYYGSHRKVTVAVGLINLLWLLPLALVTAMEWANGALVVVVAYLPLFALALWWNAGGADEPAVPQPT